MKYIKGLIISIVLFLFTTGNTFAQCAMCKAVAENAVDEGGYGIAAGLNIGILFIMVIPYILLSILVLVFFRKQVGGFWKSFNNIH